MSDITNIRVMEVLQNGLQIVINKGLKEGVNDRDVFLLYSKSESDYVDPVTKNNLGKLEIVHGRARVIHLQDHMATLMSIEYSTPDYDVRPHKHEIFFDPRGSKLIPLQDVSEGDFARIIKSFSSESEIKISDFERQIAAEYMRVFGDEISSLDPLSSKATMQIMNVAATTAAIAIKLFSEKISDENTIIDGGTF